MRIIFINCLFHPKPVLSLPLGALKTLIGTMSRNYCATLVNSVSYFSGKDVHYKSTLDIKEILGRNHRFYGNYGNYNSRTLRRHKKFKSFQKIVFLSYKTKSQKST